MNSPDTQVQTNPFPGLRAFTLDEEHLYFGMEEQVDELMRLLRTTHFLAVLGASGSGKSSLVRAGLLPGLFSGYMVKAGSKWRTAMLMPGNDPIGNLAAALSDPDVLGGDAEDQDLLTSIMESTLTRSKLGLIEAVREARLRKGENILIVVDQFEELFRFRNNRQIAASVNQSIAFVNLLLEAAQQSEFPIYVVLTMRSDFLGDCAQFQDLPQAINKGQYLVRRMTREERRLAIDGPVAVSGTHISKRLEMRLLNDVGDNPDQLPILQHALMRTWDRWLADHKKDEPIDLRHYEAAGTMASALSRHAEEAYAELRDKETKAVAALMFKGLTQKGSNGRGVRRPASIRELAKIAGSNTKTIKKIVETFRKPGRSFLMPGTQVKLTDDTVVDISHESLMRVWTRMIKWVSQETESAEFYVRLASAADRNHYKPDEAGLWKNPELQLAQLWRDSNNPNATWAQRYHPGFELAMIFLDKSQKAHDKEIALALREQRRRLRRARWMTIGAVLLSIIFLGLVLWALQQRSAADQATNDALDSARVASNQRQLATLALDSARTAEEMAKQQASIAEIEKRRAREAQDSVAKAKQEVDKLLRTLGLKSEELRKNIKELDAKNLAMKAKDDSLQRSIESLDKSKQEAVELSKVNLENYHRALAKGVGIDSRNLQNDVTKLDQSLFLALQAYKLYHRLSPNSESPEIYHALSGHSDILDNFAEDMPAPQYDYGVRVMAMSSAGDWMASGGDEGMIQLFRSGKSTPLMADGRIRAMAVRQDNSLLAVGTLNKTLQLWRQSRNVWKQFKTIPTPATPRSICFVPGGNKMVFVDTKGGMYLSEYQDTDGNPRRLIRTGIPSQFIKIAMSKDGNVLAGISQEGGKSEVVVGPVKDWLDGDPDQLRHFAIKRPETLSGVALSHDGARVAVGNALGTVWVWRLDGGTKEWRNFRVQNSAISALSFSPDGKRLASASLDRSVGLFNLEIQSDSPILIGTREWIWDLHFSPDGDRLICAGEDGKISVYPTNSTVLFDELCANEPFADDENMRNKVLTEFFKTDTLNIPLSCNQN